MEHDRMSLEISPLMLVLLASCLAASPPCRAVGSEAPAAPAARGDAAAVDPPVRQPPRP